MANRTARRQEIAEKALKRIRADAKIGSGSCSHVDECYSDEELRTILMNYLLNDTARSVNTLVKIMHDDHIAYEEHAEEIRATAF